MLMQIQFYLVKVIHDIEGGINTVVITSNDSSKKIKLSEYTELKSDILDSLQKELLRLKEYNILGNENITIDSDTEISMIDKIYKSGNTEYTIKRVSLKKDKEYNLEREEKTGKILYMFLDKDDIYIKDKQELLKKYVNYLDLYIIDDWKFENKMIKNEKSKYFLEFECNTLKSEKAGLTAYLIENENNYILSVHSSNGFSNVVEYYSE